MVPRAPDARQHREDRQGGLKSAQKIRQHSPAFLPGFFFDFTQINSKFVDQLVNALPAASKPPRHLADTAVMLLQQVDQLLFKP
jgi:hypothetical protein